MIEGVEIHQLKQFLDERGKVMHMLRSDDHHFMNFGEIYFSTINPGAIKGWHLHTKMTLNYAVPHGLIKFVLYDSRPDSKTKGLVQEIFIGPENYCLVKVPPFVWNGFKGVSSSISIVANCATIPHSAGEIQRLNPFDEKIPYNWELKNC
jgi:dTDP-4-dehydrorhamnose 3,5-epimerase